MKMQALFCLVVVFCLARADEYESEKAPVAKAIVEDEQSETTSLVEMDEEQQQKKLGFCHWGVKLYYKTGYAIRCSCMRCICRRGIWNCAYHFAYCPYYYCGNQIYNPQNQLCCCGKIYTKRAAFNCCGYFYYNTRTSKCCNYYSVKPKNANCPRYQIGGGPGQGPIKG